MRIKLNLNLRFSMGRNKEPRKQPRDRPFKEGVGIGSWFFNYLISILVIISPALREYLTSLPEIVMMV